MVDVEGVVREIGDLDHSQVIEERYLTLAEDAKRNLHVSALIEQGEK